MECDEINERRKLQQKKASKTFNETKIHKTIEKRILREIIDLKTERKKLQEEKYSLQEEIWWYELELSSQWN